MAFLLLVHDVVERPHLLDAFVAGSPRAQPALAELTHHLDLDLAKRSGACRF